MVGTSSSLLQDESPDLSIRPFSWYHLGEERKGQKSILPCASPNISADTTGGQMLAGMKTTAAYLASSITYTVGF